MEATGADGTKGRFNRERKMFAMNNHDKGSRLVYSTEFGTMCPECNHPKNDCVCRKKKKPVPGRVPPRDGIVRLMRETKGRKGKGVTLITGLPLDDTPLKQLAKSLKQKCGSGGSIKNGVIEIQGDHRTELEKELTRLGYKVKRAGG